MKFSQSSVVYFNYSLQYAIRDLARLGYDGIEIYGGRQHMYRHDLDKELDEIRALLEECNMKVCNVIPAQFRYPSVLCSSNEDIRRDSVAYIKTAIDNAQALDAPSVNVCPGMVCRDHDIADGRRQLMRSFDELADYVSDKPVYCLIEPAHRFETNLLFTIDDTLEALEQIGSNKFGVLLDTGHCNVNGEDLAKATISCFGKPLHIHIDDNHGDADAHLIPGRGSIDFAPFAQALEKIGYDGFVSAELGAGYIMEPGKACEETLQSLRSIFNRIPEETAAAA